MRRYYILLIGTLAAACATYAQQLTGRVVDTQNQSIEFANVALYVLPDSVLVTGTITDAHGDFTIERGVTKRALLKISFVGYETQTVEARPGVTVTLKPESTQLAEVTVRANRPAIRLKNDALVASVQGSMLSQAGTANDVLRRLPSLTVDSKGNISVFGKGEAKIYINRREVRDLSELDQLNSADIRDVKIIRNPGAGYDASVKAVIRINTVRNAGDGFGFDARSSWYEGETTDLRE
jgi:tonB-dependent receptor plug domain-containing protein